MFSHYQKNNKKLIWLIVIGAIMLAAATFSEKFQHLIAATNFTDSIMLLIYLPGFFILTGLIEVWLPAKFIAKHLGKKSGLKGSIYSFLIGSLMIGPLYLAFPIAIVLLRKGVSKLNVILFISAWSVFPIGQEIFEIQFMGLKFFLLRAIFSIIFAVITSLIMNKMNVIKEVE